MTSDHPALLRACGALALLGFALLAGCQAPRRPDSAAPASSAGSPTAAYIPATTAEVLLEFESPTGAATVHREELCAVIDLAVARFAEGATTDPEDESLRSMRFFQTVDRALVERGFIFPPRGLVELLHQSLAARTLALEEYERCRTQPENRRRLDVLTRLKDTGGPVHVADCDIAAVITLAAAERLGLPVKLVCIPNHMFLRWSSPGFERNWDPNSARSIHDGQYAHESGVTDEGRRHLGWLEPMSQPRVLSYWHRSIGHWHERHARHGEALVQFRLAVQSDPSDLESQDALAWFLATCPDAAHRDAAEAEAIAARLVALWPRGAWIDTLAAAQAERGAFAAAVATKQNSPRVGIASTGDINPPEPAADSDDAVRAYARGLTYAEGVAAGIIYAPRATLPYDD